MDLETALKRALADARIPAHFGGIVKTLHEQESEDWRTCCGSRCTPCVTDLARAVDRLRELLRTDA